ncbi:hypothetical protein K4G60_g1132 [Candida parapsilosis]|nr:hypothetical protein K4G60_g1132 [Candida parapsilosis]KAI5907108.1 hypothetical protein K4G61_g768 [Candida parapsilosis]
MSKDTPKLVEHALTTLSKVIESDTNISTIDLNLLENLNTNQSLNYIKLENNLNDLEANGKHLKLLSMLESERYANMMKEILLTLASEEEFDQHANLLVDIEKKVMRLEEIVNELNSWSKELEMDLKK